MRQLGLLLISVGFLTGAYGSVIDTEAVDWNWVGAGLALGLIGVVLARVGAHKLASAEETVLANLAQVESSLQSLVDKVSALDQGKESLDPYEVHHRIDADFMEDLDRFVEAREAISQRYGLQAYGEVMTHFANAERYLNRCWSASTDGYIDEVIEYIGRSKNEFNRALNRLSRAAG